MNNVTGQEIEIRREKVFLPSGITLKEIMANYGISDSSARESLKRGWFVKNYGRNQVIIDREHFDPMKSYSVAKQVFYKNFRKNPIAQAIKEDLIQEAVSLMFMQSGKIKEGSNGKYNDKYGYWWCAHNGMLAYLKTWIRQTRYDVELQEDIHPMMTHGNRRYLPEYGWMYC